MTLLLLSFGQRLQGLLTPGMSVRLSVLIAGPVIDYLEYACYVTSIFRFYEGVPTLVCPRLLWLNDPLEETLFLRPIAPLPVPVYL